ncbi:MAG: MFS transporter [Patescibacteria group bacterium]
MFFSRILTARSALPPDQTDSHKRTLVFLAVLMLINALSYGTIIPLLYPYASRFGIDPLGLSFLFASFSLFQFLATPIIGRLSDIYGRRPLLLLSLLGTSLSLAFFASATSVLMLFLARILDGITGGNMSVAQAVIADRVEGKERAKAFGLLGASFGFGFLIGPAIGGLLSEINITFPFWFAAGLALTATIFGYFFLEETLDDKNKKVRGDEPFFDFKAFVGVLKRPVMGMLMLTVLIISLAQNAFFIGFQSYTVDVLMLSPREIGLLFAASGLVNLLMQAVGIRVLLRKITNHEHIILGAELGAAALIGALGFISNFSMFVAFLFVYMMFSGPILTIISGMISERASSKEQGGLLGINASYMSLGQIGGPLMAGVVATYSIPGVFILGLVLFLVAFGVSLRASRKADLQAKVPA